MGRFGHGGILQQLTLQASVPNSVQMFFFEFQRLQRNLIPCKTKLQLYLTAILPHLTSCQIVWHFCKKSDRRKLERIQERALRIIFNNKTNTYEDVLGRAELSSLYNRRLQDIAILIYKVRNGLAPEHIAERNYLLLPRKDAPQ